MFIKFVDLTSNMEFWVNPEHVTRVYQKSKNLNVSIIALDDTEFLEVSGTPEEIIKQLSADA